MHRILAGLRGSRRPSASAPRRGLAAIVIVAACTVLAPTAARAQPAAAGDPEADALDLANRAAAVESRAGDWHSFIETAVTGTRPRGGRTVDGARLSADLRYDGSPAPGWRLVFADRLDVIRQQQPYDDVQVNTLKELYVGWQPQPQTTVELGRINLRGGVALGYNPTDFFKTDALRSITSIDPARLRENRLGTVMLRGQRLWEGGSLGALFAPRLTDAPSNADFSPDWGATNRGARWLVTASHPLGGDFSPRWLLHGGDDVATQLGVEATRLVGNATVAFVELSAGRTPALRARIDGSADDNRLRSRLAAGFTHTTAANLSVTIEYDYNGAALDRQGLQELARQPGGRFARYLGLAAAQQDLASRQGLFVHLNWQNAFVRRLDLAAMQRIDLERSSRLSWAEARYRFDRFDVALQWQRASGAPDSVFGALPTQRAVQALARIFF